MSAVCFLSSTSRGSVDLASVGEPDETCFSGFRGQVQPDITGRTFAIRVASAGVNTCSCSLAPPQPPTTIAATTAIAPRVMATVTTRAPRTGRKRVLLPRLGRETVDWAMQIGWRTGHESITLPATAFEGHS